MRSTLNPYRRAAALIAYRLWWDIRPEAWRSRRALRDLRDRHADEKAVILCNGPSLLKSDLESLDGVFTFGLNKINLLFDRYSFRPSCIVSVNRHVLQQNADFFRSTELPLFLDAHGTKWVPPADNRVFLHSTPINGFARDCSVSVCQGSTVTYVALQLAFHMGFRHVALIGADHNFDVDGNPHELVESGSQDPNHFDPRYFAGGVKWQLPDLPDSERSYLLAREVFRASGGEVVNATVGGNLEIFERTTLEHFLSSSMQSKD